MIRFDHVSNDWGDFSLRDVSFTVEKGEYFVILGPTGAGKTLILETIAGFYSPMKGKVLLRGKDGEEMLPEQRGLGFVYQDYALFPHMTVEENIRFGLEMRKTTREDAVRRVESVMGLLNIVHLRDRFPRSLSGGELQRTAVARALVIEPDILLLDEPLSALDSRTREKLREEIKRLHRIGGMTTVHVTHDQTEALLLGDRVAVIIDGELAQIGTPEQVFNKPSSVTIARFMGTENIIPGRIVNSSEDVAVVDCDKFTAVVHSALQEGEVYLTVRPENIILSEAPIESSARNVVENKVTTIVKLGHVVQVQMDTGLSAVVTNQSVEELDLRPGKRVYASFKATAVHLIKRLGL